MATRMYGEVYEVVSPRIDNSQNNESFEQGEVIVLDRPWNVSWLLEVGAIKLSEEINGQDKPTVE